MRYLRFSCFIFAALLVFFAEQDVCGQWVNVAPGLLPKSTEFGAMCFKNGILWAGNTELWKSQDTGKTWMRSNFPTTSIITDISFFDILTGVVSTEPGNVFLTNDGGQSWKNILNPPLIYRVNFNQSSKIIHALQFKPAILFTSTDEGNTWINSTFDIYGRSFAITKKHALCVSSDEPYLTGFRGWINASTDLGATWSNNGAYVDGDSFSLSADSCDDNRLYLDNEDYAGSNNNLSEIFLTTDRGLSWRATSSHPGKYFSGAMVTTKNVIYAGTVNNNGVERSIDNGVTWKNISGPSINYDSRTMTVVNDNILFMFDGNGDIWATFNSGGDSVTITPNGSVSINPNVLFQNDTIKCNPIGQFLNLSFFGCNPPSITKSKIIGRDSLSYLSISKGDSTEVICDPKDSGDLNANLILTFNNGASDTISLKGYSIGRNPLSIATTDQSTDTIGGYINIPITISGLDHPEDIELVVHYEKDLKYDGSFSGAVQLDIPNEQWAGRSKLHIAQAKPDVISGFAKFEIFGDSLPLHVTFDSMTVLTAIAPCVYSTGSGYEHYHSPIRLRSTDAYPLFAR